MLKKMKSKKGFTLVEMLIVVAIIAVLVVVAIPIYNAQLERARERVDAANARTASSMAVADYLLESYTGPVAYTFTQNSEEELAIAGKYGAATNEGMTGETAPTTNAAPLIMATGSPTAGELDLGPAVVLVVTVDYANPTAESAVINTWITGPEAP